MRKTSHLKKFIPVSMIIHATAIFAAGLVTAPLILKQDTPVEMALGTGDSEQPETLGIDVLATQGTHQESTSEVAEAQSADLNQAAPQALAQEPKATPIETPKATPATPIVAASQSIKSDSVKSNIAPIEKSISTKSADVAPAITSEELIIPVAKEEPRQQETPQDLSPAETAPPVAIAVTLPEETQEEVPTPEITKAEVASTTSKEVKPAPIAASSTTETAKSESKSTDSENSASKSADSKKSEMAALKNSEGIGAGTNGTNAPSQGLAGSATGIKSLEQIRQRAGNPKPRYDRDERLRGDKGTVVFKAYINPAGQPVKIEKITSSGHPNLDTKSLVALEKWKFEPGQEGWVEVPFKWDLKGDSQEIGGSLRRSAANPVETP